MGADPPIINPYRSFAREDPRTPTNCTTGRCLVGGGKRVVWWRRSVRENGTTIIAVRLRETSGTALACTVVALLLAIVAALSSPKND
jgi:hypothetical protein